MQDLGLIRVDVTATAIPVEAQPDLSSAEQGWFGHFPNYHGALDRDTIIQMVVQQFRGSRRIADSVKAAPYRFQVDIRKHPDTSEPDQNATDESFEEEVFQFVLPAPVENPSTAELWAVMTSLDVSKQTAMVLLGSGPPEAAPAPESAWTEVDAPLVATRQEMVSGIGDKLVLAFIALGAAALVLMLGLFYWDEAKANFDFMFGGPTRDIVVVPPGEPPDDAAPESGVNPVPPPLVVGLTPTRTETTTPTATVAPPTATPEPTPRQEQPPRFFVPPTQLGNPTPTAEYPYPSLSGTRPDPDVTLTITPTPEPTSTATPEPTATPRKDRAMAVLVAELRQRLTEKVGQVATTENQEEIAIVLEYVRATLIALAQHPDDAEFALRDAEVDTKTAALILGVHPEHVRYLIRQGQLPAVKENGEFRIALSTIVDLMVATIQGVELTRSRAP